MIGSDFETPGLEDKVSGVLERFGVSPTGLFVGIGLLGLAAFLPFGFLWFGGQANSENDWLPESQASLNEPDPFVVFGDRTRWQSVRYQPAEGGARLVVTGQGSTSIGAGSLAAELNVTEPLCLRVPLQVVGESGDDLGVELAVTGDETTTVRYDTTQVGFDAASIPVLDKAATPELVATVPVFEGANTMELDFIADGSARTSAQLLLGPIELSPEGCSPALVLADVTKVFAVGDSYASGFGVPPFVAGTAPDDNNCQQSEVAYGAQVAAQLRAEYVPLACQAATTAEVASQIERLGSDAGVVVLTVGANDTRWVQELVQCVTTSYVGFRCSSNDGLNDRLAEVLRGLSSPDAGSSDVVSYSELVDEITERAPFAHLVIVAYPELFPPNGVELAERAGFLNQGRCEGFLLSDQRWINEVQDDFVDSARSVADIQNVTVVDPNFAGHELCRDDPWIFSVDERGTFHPNEAGHAALAFEVLEVL